MPTAPVLCDAQSQASGEVGLRAAQLSMLLLLIDYMGEMLRCKKALALQNAVL
jgi:hypothetical protein